VVGSGDQGPGKATEPARADGRRARMARRGDAPWRAGGRGARYTRVVSVVGRGELNEARNLVDSNRYGVFGCWNGCPEHAYAWGNLGLQSIVKWRAGGCGA